MLPSQNHIFLLICIYFANHYFIRHIWRHVITLWENSHTTIPEKKVIPCKYTIGIEQVTLHVKYVAAVWPIFKSLLSQILEFADKAILTDPPQHEEKINMKRIQRVYRKNTFIYTFSTAIKRPETSLDFVTSLHSLWHDLRLEMSLNFHFNHIHVITYKNRIFISH